MCLKGMVSLRFAEQPVRHVLADVRLAGEAAHARLLGRAALQRLVQQVRSIQSEAGQLNQFGPLANLVSDECVIALGR